MAKVSVIIPSRNERFLSQTIADIFSKAQGDIEIIAVLDGYWPDPPMLDRPNLIVIHRSEAQGMRSGINSAAAIANGDYLMKCDAHCMFAEGWDETLKAECDVDWVVIPRRLSLDAEAWAIKDTGKAPVDYHYLCYPYMHPNEPGIHGCVWNERARERKDILLDDEMSSQGSCWFMSKRHFGSFLGGLSCEGYGTFVQEFQEIGLKTWLGGGQVKVNKKTWYAHLHKGKEYGRGYFISKGGMERGIRWSLDYWVNDRWAERQHDLAWLVDKFWPIPTWPADWRDQLARTRVQDG
jgi:glycosyltransferase involved in cell wall biosynthesis